MTIRIGSNILSLLAQRNLNKASDTLNGAIARLSSGMRINNASDDAAGLAVATSLNLDARVSSQAIRNVSDGVSMLNIAQGALEQLSTIATRQVELAEQAANGTYTLQQRSAMHTEANALVDEWNRITASTTFNGISVFDSNTGAVRIQAGYGVDGSISVNTNSDLDRAVGTGTFTVSQTFTAGGNVGTAVIADLDSDGINDLIIGREGWRKGNGDGTFGAATALAQTAGQNYYFSADINNDGKADLVTTTTTNVNVSLGLGNGTFGTTQSLALGASPLHLTFGDFDNNGSLDIAVPEYGPGTGTTVRIFMNNGNGTFSDASTVITTESGPYQVASGDFNGDNKADLAVATRGTGRVAVMYGDGRGSFSTATTFALSGLNNASGVKSVDFNLDGYDDLVVTGSNGVRVVMANSNGTFAAAKTIGGPTSSFSSTPAVGDVNGDGYQDVVIADSSVNTIYTIAGNGDGTFRYVGGVISPLLNAIQIPALGDINNDGVLDVIASTNAGNYVMAAVSNTNQTTSIGKLNLMTQAHARSALNSVKANLDRVSAELGSLGASQSRLSIAHSTLQVANENARAAASRILDTDVAEESAIMIAAKIRQQAATAILAQANMAPQLALTLLRA